MTRIDIQHLSFRLKEKRDEFEADVENGLCERGEYRQFLRDELGGDSHCWQPATERTAADLHAELTTAARAAQDNGASQAQIDLIVSLATEQGDLTGLGYGLLTSRAASRIIEDMKG